MKFAVRELKGLVRTAAVQEVHSHGVVESARGARVKLALVLPGGVDRSGVDRVIPALLWLIERLARRHEVHVFATRQEPEPGQWELLGARVHNAGTARGSTRRLLARFASVHRDGRPFDVVHGFFGWCGAAAAIIGWRHRLPVVFHAAGGELVALRDIEYGMRTTLGGRMGLRVALAGARRVTVASEFMQRLAEQRAVRAECVPLGVALDSWPVSAPRARDRSRPLRLLHVGDLRPVKDQTTLMTAAGHLQDAGVDFTLEVVGLDTMSGSIHALPATRRVEAQTRWHGVLRRDALRRLMNDADLLVVTSRHEAGPVVALEAAVAGIPTVGTAVGHVVDWAPDAAVAVPVGDAVTLAREIAALDADDSRRMCIAREAQRRAIAIDADYTAAAFERIYHDVASRA
jgi:glycosyltransferase involved in cell wall biosynthesis